MTFDFIPFLDRNYNTPIDLKLVKEYQVSLIDNINNKLKIGSFKGDHNEMRGTGGISVFSIPEKAIDKDNLLLLVEVLDNNGDIVPLMIESKWDIVLEGKRVVMMGSKQFTDVVARVYYMNRPANKCPVRLSVQQSGEKFFLNSRNKRSPIVANWKESLLDGDMILSDSNGKVIARIRIYY